MPTLTSGLTTYVLDLGSDENRFSPDWMTVVEDALDKVVADPKPLVAIGEGKFFSNGLDLEWVMANMNELASYTARVQQIFARILTLPVPTVAALNGHAFGAGAMLAMAFDWRIMREDRGYFCFPEVDIQIPFTPGMAALIQSKVTPQAAITAMTTGHRFGAAEAVVAGIVDGSASEADLFDLATARVAPLAGKPADTLGAIKRTMYAEAVRALTEGEST